MGGDSQKTFYLETFGCQMNVHDSEKVVGTLVQEGYRQVETVELADLILYNTCSIRDKAEQKVFNRLNDYKKLRSREKVRRTRMCRPTGRRKDFRTRAVCFIGLRVGIIPEPAADAGAAGKWRARNRSF